MGNFCGRPIRMLFLHRLDILASKSAANIHIFFDTWCLWDKVLFKCKESSTLKNGRMTWNGDSISKNPLPMSMKYFGAAHIFMYIQIAPLSRQTNQFNLQKSVKRFQENTYKLHLRCGFAEGSLFQRYFNGISTLLECWNGIEVVWK